MATEPGGTVRGRAGDRLASWLAAPVSIAPLAVFRIGFGLLMAAAMVRFWANGWIQSLYVDPAFHFTYPGFSWVKPLGPAATHGLFLVIGLSALGIALGLWYRASAWIFFLGFTYAELMDKANYLNHYYFVSLAAFLLLWVPAHGAYSLDALRRPSLRRGQVARWQVGIFKAQIGIVYFFAGLAKVNADWLINAQPLSLWLPAKTHLPVIGTLLDWKATAYAFSWAGAAFDLSIAFLLLNRRTVYPAYAAVLVFHGLTAWLFPMIGVFPFVMALAASVFLPESVHARILSLLRRPAVVYAAQAAQAQARPFPALLALFFAVQALLPFRYALHPGELFWTENGYRFSWRVMLMEKAGQATFYVTDPATGRRAEVDNCEYLTAGQEKMMSTQPDMILEFARHVAANFSRKGVRDPEVRVHSYVTLNGRGSRLYLDTALNLAALPLRADLTPWLQPAPQDL